MWVLSTSVNNQGELDNLKKSLSLNGSPFINGMKLLIRTNTKMYLKVRKDVGAYFAGLFDNDWKDIYLVILDKETYLNYNLDKYLNLQSDDDIIFYNASKPIKEGDIEWIQVARSYGNHLGAVVVPDGGRYSCGRVDNLYKPVQASYKKTYYIDFFKPDLFSVKWRECQTLSKQKTQKYYGLILRHKGYKIMAKV